MEKTLDPLKAQPGGGWRRAGRSLRHRENAVTLQRLMHLFRYVPVVFFAGSYFVAGGVGLEPELSSSACELAAAIR